MLIWAAARGDSRTVEKLLACGAHPENKCLRQRTPLHYAASADVSTAEILLDAKADVNVTDEFGRTPMHYVNFRTNSLITRMVGLGANIEKRDLNGQTPLLVACQYGHAYTVKELLACGADVNVCDVDGFTPIVQAVKFNRHSAISILLSSPSLRFGADDRNESDFFSHVALYSDVQTLIILEEEWQIGTGFEETFDVCEALELARYRRDYNALWSKEFTRPEDEDPVAWHEAFIEMINTIIKRSEQASDSEDEIWEDARVQSENPVSRAGCYHLSIATI